MSYKPQTIRLQKGQSNIKKHVLMFLLALAILVVVMVIGGTTYPY